jgi:hypothetical protein
MARSRKVTKKVIISENFKSLNHLLNTMEERPLNKAFQNVDIDRIASQRDESKKDHSFSGTNTYEETMNIIKKGYVEPLEKMKKALLKMSQADKYQRPRLKNDYVGFIPHVPNTLMNLPQTMINKEKQAYRSKTIHIIYSFCVLGNVTTDEIIKAGINIIGLINSLEKQGYRIKLDTIFTSVSNNNTYTASMLVNLKEYGQTLNLLKLAFPLVHPSMLRRIAFKWLETTPDNNEKSYVNGYGKTLGNTYNNDAKKEKEFLIKNGILKGDNVFYTNAYEAMKYNDIEELAKCMEIIK